jgi:hypothetical protein
MHYRGDLWHVLDGDINRFEIPLVSGIFQEQVRL